MYANKANILIAEAKARKIILIYKYSKRHRRPFSFAVDTETDYAGKYFKLTTDIDMTGINNMKPIGNNFGTEGTKLKAFSGTFDGNKHKISNLNMIYKGKNNIGVALFGILKDAKVMNLTLTNAHFEADAIVASIA